MSGALLKGSTALVCLLLTAPAFSADIGLGSGRDGPFLANDAGVLVNSYAIVVAPVAAGATSVAVPSTQGFHAGDLVMLLELGTAATPDSGDGTPVDLAALGDVGQFELTRIQSIIGTTIVFVAPLGISLALPAEVIRVPEFIDVTVPAGASVVAAPWDGANGGVLAFVATGNVTVNGTLGANAAGYRGGPKVLAAATSGCSGFDLAPTGGAPKGEGVVAARFGPTGTGRGNVANAGGGGVCDASGGGGGANGGLGGKGGLSGDGARDVGGFGGAPLVGSAKDFLTFGGGGGAGHWSYSGNPPSEPQGGRGGGIVWFHAASLAGTGRIEALGQTAFGNNAGGAGGGGAGGTLVVRVVGTAECGALDARGADGAPMLNQYNAIGPGGGGGGGRIFLQGASTSGCPTDVRSGIAGTAAYNLGDPFFGATPVTNSQVGFVGSVEALATPFDPDAGADGGVGADGGAGDGGANDAGLPADGGLGDAGASDAGSAVDAGADGGGLPVDGGGVDAGTGSADAGTDGGLSDGGAEEDGGGDGGAADDGGASADAGTTDDGGVDGGNSLGDGGAAGPRFTSSPNATAWCGLPYRYSPSRSPVVDAPGPVTFLVRDAPGAPLPAGLTVDAETGEVRWIPSGAQEGPQAFDLVASGPSGETAQRVSVTVECPEVRGTVVGCGCSAPAGWPGLALLAVALRGVRRRRQ